MKRVAGFASALRTAHSAIVTMPGRAQDSDDEFSDAGPAAEVRAPPFAVQRSTCSVQRVSSSTVARACMPNVCFALHAYFMQLLLGFVEEPEAPHALLRHRFPSKVGGRPVSTAAAAAAACVQHVRAHARCMHGPLGAQLRWGCTRTQSFQAKSPGWGSLLHEVCMPRHCFGQQPGG